MFLPWAKGANLRRAKRTINKVARQKLAQRVNPQVLYAMYAEPLLSSTWTFRRVKIGHIKINLRKAKFT